MFRDLYTLHGALSYDRAWNANDATSVFKRIIYPVYSKASLIFIAKRKILLLSSASFCHQRSLVDSFTHNGIKDSKHFTRENVPN